MISGSAIREEAAPWGLSTSLDLYGCNPEIIRDSEKIKRYARELCDLINMKPFGDCQVVNFGKDECVKGYSLIQLIETSLISGHFSNFYNAAYIDIFSCKTYEPEQAARFSKIFFEAESVGIHVMKRM